MKRDIFLNFIVISAASVLAAVLLWLFGKYIIACILPFIIAYLISLAIEPAAVFISDKARVKKGFVAFVLIILALALVFTALGQIISRLVKELYGFIVYIGETLGEDDNFLKKAFDWFGNLKSRFSFLDRGGGNGEIADAFYNAVIDMAESGLSRISASLGTFVTKFIGGLPSFIFALITTVISLFYMCVDRSAVREELYLLLGKNITSKINRFRLKTGAAFGKYLKSYFLIMLVTFAELLLGFVIMRIEYALLLALLISIVDILPVLGSGTVLVPWAVFKFITGDSRLGAGLIILWVIMYIVRQIIEPRIVGSVMGIHPLISLFAIYMGFILFGIGGMIFFPILIYLIKIFVTELREE